MSTFKAIMNHFVFFLIWMMVSFSAAAQDAARQEGAVLWDDFEEGINDWRADRAATDLGTLFGEGVNGSTGWGIFLNADSEGFWAARLQHTFEAPENSFETAWRVQFSAKVDLGPTAVSARMARAAEPYTSTEDIMPYLEIPAGSEGQFFHFDYLVPLSPFLDTPEIIFLFGIIGLNNTEMVLDDLYIYPWNAVAMLTFENADITAVAEAVGGTLEQVMEDQKEGVYSAKMVVSNGGNTRSDAELVALWTPYPDPWPRPFVGNYRISVQAKSSVAPLQVQAGIIDRTADSRSNSPTEQTITATNTWQKLSFLVRLSSDDADEYGFFFDSGGQGAHEVMYDMVIVEPTDEEITGIENWPLQ